MTSAWEKTERRVRQVPCPRCGAPVAEGCRDRGSPHGRRLYGNRVHHERLVAVRLVERQTVDG